MELITLLAIVNSSLLLAISLLHFYWAIGGRWGADAAVPSTTTGKKLFVPGAVSCAVVGSGLIVFVAIELGCATIFLHFIPVSFFKFGNLVLGFVFMARVIGELKYVGIFKKVKGTLFSANDTRYYVPLCAFISSISFAINFQLWTLHNCISFVK